ncbi:IS66 family insertion sequence element accessory protein TnpA [Sphingobacterium siyangense]|uniref:IS66 family insertion sequence element accessory protein TnpA n=1 Tax=Sphingobacterium siyangense TaxID=459529 RepID=UPI003DA1E958
MNNLQEKRERMLSMIADWQQSGKSKKAYCTENGIKEATFYYWFSRSKENESTGGNLSQSTRRQEGTMLRLSIPTVCV